MEAIIATPAQSLPSGVNVQAENNGDNTSFAPVLAEAVSNETKTSSQGKKQDNKSEYQEKQPHQEDSSANIGISTNLATTEINTFSIFNHDLFSQKVLSQDTDTIKNSSNHVKVEQAQSDPFLLSTQNKDEKFPSLATSATSSQHQDKDSTLQTRGDLITRDNLKTAQVPLTPGTNENSSLLKQSQQPQRTFISTAVDTTKTFVSHHAIIPKESDVSQKNNFTSVEKSLTATIDTNLTKYNQNKESLNSPEPLNSPLSFTRSALSQVTSTNKLNQLLDPNTNDSIQWLSSKNNIKHSFPRNSASYLNYGNDSTLETPKTLFSSDNIVARLTDLPVEAEGQNNFQRQTNSLRHDINSQYLEAKLQKSDLKTEQQNEQRQSSGSQQDSAKQSLLLSQSSKTPEVLSESSFTNTASNLLFDKSGLQMTVSPKPIMSPLATPVYDDDILLQVVRKFRSSPKLQDSKLVMKLHPAELGELKINIQLKGGSISATIIAQSQHVQEMLDKNLPKLRSLMEQQGLSVTDISVELDSDVIADYNLFQQQFSKNEYDDTTRKTTKSSESFDVSMEDAESEHMTPQSGVNVKV